MFTKWARWVILSTKAAVNTGSPKISCQRSKPKLVVMMVDFLPALSERWLNNNSAPFLSNETYPNSSHITRSDRKSTRLNSSHVRISYAVFCLKKKKKQKY